jgi:predicted Zn finger-like uncharacterized protein
MMVGVAGFEPATLWSQTRCATRLRYTPIRVLLQYILNILKDKDVQNEGNFNRICYIKIMIIECLNCNKKFNVVDDLIPDGGRLIQCGSCDHSWHYKNENIKLETTLATNNDNNQKIPILDDIQENNNNRNLVDDYAPVTKKQELITELTKVKKNIKTNNTKVEKNRVVNFFSYLLVFIISFVALIILIDTLKSPLISFFPGLEIFLFNFFESLKDVKLFIIDLT